MNPDPETTTATTTEEKRDDIGEKDTAELPPRPPSDPGMDPEGSGGDLEGPGPTGRG